MGEVGFSFVGVAFLLALFIPNILWAAVARPADFDPSGESRVLRWFERIGQAATVVAAVLFADTNLRP